MSRPTPLTDAVIAGMQISDGGKHNVSASLTAHARTLERSRDEAAKLVSALLDCHEERCDGRPGCPCPHPKRARAFLAALDKETI